MSDKAPSISSKIVIPDALEHQRLLGSFLEFEKNFHRNYFPLWLGTLIGPWIVTVIVFGVVYVGDDTTNDVGILRSGVFTDYGGPITRIASSFIKIEEGSPRCDNLILHCAQGVGNTLPPGVSPVVELRFSDNQGRTFVPWRQASLGTQGGYGNRALWQKLDQMRAPGRLVEVRVSDPVNVVLSHLELNANRPAN